MAGKKKRRATAQQELAVGDEGGQEVETEEDCVGLLESEQVPSSGLPDAAIEEEEKEEAHGDGDAESLGQLLVDMTTQVQDERGKRNAAEKRSQALLRELDQLQKEVLALRASSCVRAAESVQAVDVSGKNTTLPALEDETDASGSWKELLDAKKAKEKALSEAHQRAMQVQELNACISMQHDELTALRSSARADREAREASDAAARELRQERQLLQQEAALLRDGSTQLQAEMGKRGAHFKALMEKWTEAQAQSEHRERENAALREQLQAARTRVETCERELETLRDERDALQRQSHQLKGAVAAKTAESKAFQAYGASARDHLQSQRSAMQRHAVYRRQVHELARDAISSVRGLRATLALTRAPLLALQADVHRFIMQLRAPVVALVERSTRFARAAQAEHAPLRLALYSAELARRHLHEQLWRSRRDALLVCQLQATGKDDVLQADISGHQREQEQEDNGGPRLLLRANYATGELFLRERQRGKDAEARTLRCDALLSDRAREWSGHESVTPLLQTVLDGGNACVATFVGSPPLRVTNCSSNSSSSSQQTVAELLLRELFAAVGLGGGDARFKRVKVTISFLAVYGEVVYDLLGLETASSASDNTAARQIVVLEVQNAEEALLVLAGGRERLTDKPHATGSSFTTPLLPRPFTHTVVTVCLSYESLLVDVPPIKAKLQIVELALGADSDTGAGMAVSRLSMGKEELQQRVALENGAAALVTALAEVRIKDASFVRYHSSKLTVLLQDTIKHGAKFLMLVALPAACWSQHELGECDPVAVVRVLQQMRVAVSGGGSTGYSSDAVTRDRSLEGFMNRLALQQAQGNADAGGLGLRFSSLDMQDFARRQLEIAHTECWSSELERMTKRYGRDALEALEPPAALEKQVAATPAEHSRALEAELHQERLAVATVHPLVRSSSQPPPAPAAVRKPKLSRRGSKTLRGSGSATGPGRNRAATETASSLARKRQSVAILMPTVRPEQSPAATPRAASAVTTLASAPAPKSALAAVFKIRRETASSALKKSLLASAAAAKDRTKRTPFR